MAPSRIPGYSVDWCKKLAEQREQPLVSRLCDLSAFAHTTDQQVFDQSMLFGENRQKLHGKYGYPLSSVLTEMRDQFNRNPELIIVGMFFDPNRIHVMGQLMAATETYSHAWLDRSIRRSADFPRTLTEESDLPLVLSKPSGQAATDLR
ncbi:hypothetical protein [Paraburkholderia tuberum]|uniref:hypothetical protein n=1 Tax=Paraburkholderia tuberum TaxID=157910 RepID=UPI0011600374|nr:hypothetical protein [Paraburkholderia tuberum]